MHHVAEQIITGGVISLKQIVLYLQWTSDTRPSIVKYRNIVIFQYRKRLKSNSVQVVSGKSQYIWLILGDSSCHWVVLATFGLFHELYCLYHLFFLTIFVSFKDIQSQVTLLNIDSFKVLVLFPLHIRSKYQEYAFM